MLHGYKMCERRAGNRLILAVRNPLFFFSGFSSPEKSKTLLPWVGFLLRPAGDRQMGMGES